MYTLCIIGIIDYFSKFPVLIPCRTAPTSKIIIKKLFRYWISYFGMPRSIHSDGATYFTSKEFQEFCKKHQVLKTTSCPYYPQSNGLIERLFKTIKPLLSATVVCENVDWDDALPRIEMGLRATKQETTKRSPFEIVFGNRMVLPIDLTFNVQELKNTSKNTCIDREVRQAIEKANEIQRKRLGRFSRNTEPLTEGAKVMIRATGLNKEEKFEGPYVVKECITQWKYRLEHIVTKMEKVRNYNQLKILKKATK